LKNFLKYIKGPDFPTGGIIVGRKGIYDAYKTGKGKITLRAKYEIEEKDIIIKEIPYLLIKQN
jgi:DNA gyrase subunit A (EC 5.99.1.3)